MTFVQTRPASRIFFPHSAPARMEPREWIGRAANFVFAYAEADAGETLDWTGADEHLVYLPNGGAEVRAGGQHVSCPDRGVVIVPPGRSLVSFTAAARVLRIFSSDGAQDLAALASNADAYADGAGEVSRPDPSTASPVNARLRCYRLAGYADRPMRMFRSAKLMLNVFDRAGPRDTEALTPHFHEDFEQVSFAMEGSWVHSIRYPWSKQMSKWREDEHLKIGSPSVLVIPAAVIHTSRSVSDGYSQLVDIFSPPRGDFIAQGLVCNESDYSAKAPR